MNKRNTAYTRTKRISEEIYIEAQKRADALPIFDNSHRAKEANQVGCLGEVIAECWMKINGIKYIPQLEKTTHDYKVDGHLTIDVKTKDRTVPPKIDYDNSAPLYNHSHQRPDYFLFISLRRDKNNNTENIRRFSEAYIVGSISYIELDRIGIPFLKGEKDWRNGTKFWTDCLNVEMWQLISLRETIDIFKGKLTAPTKNANINKGIIEEMMGLIERKKLKPRSLPIIIPDRFISD